MSLPFSHEQFLDVFAAYNESAWPIAAALWLLSALALGIVLAGRSLDRLVTTLLAAHWAWVAVGYHWLHFAIINPAAVAFSVGFLAQSVLFTAAAWRRSLEYSSRRSPQYVWGVALAIYGLLYPLIAAVTVGAYPRAPTFGVPCPATLYTLGLLLLATPLKPSLFVIPLLWTIIGGSAAVLLGIAPDFALVVAGLVALVYIVSQHLRRQRAT